MTRSARRELRAAVDRLEAAFRMPGDGDLDVAWEVFDLAESIEAAIAGGGPGPGFRTAPFNAAMADIRELVGRYDSELTEQQRAAVEAVRDALTAL